MFIFYLL